MSISFSSIVSGVGSAWKVGKAVYDWANNDPLKSDFERFLSTLEHRRVLYAEWQFESMSAVLASLSTILDEVRRFRSSHADNVELGILLGELIMSLQDRISELHTINLTTAAGEFKAYRALLKVRAEIARTLAILCGKTGVSPAGSDLERFIMEMALVRPRA